MPKETWMSTKPLNNHYGATSIQVMEGLEAVRKRPAMYIGSTGPNGLHHLVYEVVDNSVDEALGGHCSIIKVILHADGECSVEDNGRGIPVDIHPTEKVSAAQVVLTKLHAGGKFGKDAYKYSGGLHGVGVSVVNALSIKLYVEIYRDGKIYSQTYQKGIPLSPLKMTGTTQKQGTYIRFRPDAEIFRETTELSFDILSSRLRELAFLNPGLHISITDESCHKNHEFLFEGGIVSLVENINAKKNPIFPKIIYYTNSDEEYILEVALQYNDGYGEQLLAFVNNINTVEGGTHVAGFKSALTKLCNKKAQDLGMLKGENFSSEDVREGLVCVINIKVPEPQFEGQTKTKLGNNDVKGIVDSWSFAALSTYFEENPAIIKAILQKAIMAQQARDAARKARDLSRRKTALESSVLPGKLADCSNENPAETELFIVEGDSAGGSAKQARDRHNQAILPLRGKILNVEKARLDKMLSNEEVKALISAIGCGIDEKEFDLSRVRYHKVILMTDADVDGSHIRTLLLTFFFRYMKPIIDQGYLYIAQPPLYKVKIGKKEEYLKDDKSFNNFLCQWASEYTMLSVDNRIIENEEWLTLLNLIPLYEDKVQNVAQEFKITVENCHALAVFVMKHGWEITKNTDQLLQALHNLFAQYTITSSFEVPQNLTLDGDIDTHIPLPVALNFKMLSKEWSIGLDFFSSSELQALVSLLQPLALLETPWSIALRDKKAVLESQGCLQVLRVLNKLSKPFLNIQRYKGLGEMNPEQLWETSMDATKRQLLRVTIQDALEADSWFSILMGDDVQGRKTFIEDRGQFVRNLDV